MERTCHQCGNLLAEGAAFCFKCGAPQIRVSSP
ncbi:MAG: zinc-ribbon domain-containing protein, partial [Terriglobales bacterium]